MQKQESILLGYFSGLPLPYNTPNIVSSLCHMSKNLDMLLTLGQVSNTEVVVMSVTVTCAQCADACAASTSQPEDITGVYPS